MTKQKIEEMIKQCDSSARMQEIIEECRMGPDSYISRHDIEIGSYKI